MRSRAATRRCPGANGPAATAETQRSPVRFIARDSVVPLAALLEVLRLVRGPHRKALTMRCLILAAGRFDDTLKADIAQQREPRLDVFQLAEVLNARVIDFKD